MSDQGLSIFVAPVIQFRGILRLRPVLVTVGATVLDLKLVKWDVPSHAGHDSETHTLPEPAAVPAE